MNYTGLFITEAIFALIVTLWFARQLNWFSFYKTINDPKGILLPTTVLLIGLIVIPNIVYFYNNFSNNEVIVELLKSSTPFTAILTFFLGQFIANTEKRKYKEEQEKISAYKMLDSLDRLTSERGLLGSIDKQLSDFFYRIQDQDFDFSSFKKLCQDQLVELNRYLDESQVNQTTFIINHGRFLSTYFKRVKNFIDDSSKDPVFSPVTLYLTKKNILLAYEYKIHLAKNIIKDYTLLKAIADEIKFQREILNNENDRRKQFQELVNNNNSDENKIQSMKTKYNFLNYNYDPESSLIQEIDKILNSLHRELLN